MTQKARPSSDVSNDGWSPTPVYEQINEAIPNDSRYVTCPDSPPLAAFTVQLAPIAAPTVGVGVPPPTLTIRIAGSVATLVELLQVDEVIAAWSCQPTGSFSAFTFALTAAQAAAIVYVPGQDPQLRVRVSPVMIFEDDDTLSATGSVTLRGSVDVTEDDDTLSATGTHVISGSLSVTEDDDTLSATGGGRISGSLSVTEDDDTLSAEGSAATITGSLSVTEANDTLSATGTVAISGVVDVTEENDTLYSEGSAATITGSLSVTEDDDTLSATGTPGPGPTCSTAMPITSGEPHSDTVPASSDQWYTYPIVVGGGTYSVTVTNGSSGSSGSSGSDVVTVLYEGTCAGLTQVGVIYGSGTLMLSTSSAPIQGFAAVHGFITADYSIEFDQH